ncbi:transposase [Chryseobacterium sp. HR92]|uniref:transposase n=1 Tax=Chryseobacterium sp. HR92 TaxID=3094839 RepID=UPI00388EEAE0|nr:transposase [Chryseobacterium sp. HR92]
MVEIMYESESIDTLSLLKWSKLLEYDFFRIFTQHLILYAPPGNQDMLFKKSNILPRFRKNIYTQEVISFMLELIEDKKKTKEQIINEYGIPKTTLYKWIEKYSR